MTDRNAADGNNQAATGREGPPVRVACAVIEEDGLLLVAQRGPQGSQAGSWEFPGGKVHKGETPQQALAREIEEELGMEIVVGNPLQPSVHRYESKTIELLPFLCTISRGRPTPKEHVAVEWVSCDRAARLAWSPADIPVFQRYAGRVRNSGASEKG